MKQSGNPYVARGAGMQRQPFKIKEWLAFQGLTMADVARQAKINVRIVGDTVRGVRNHRETLKYLRSMGCPVEFLGLPEDMKIIQSKN